ncbi:MAG: hypothetical protein OCD01_14685 [Fibrobacterales bacterium]
MRFQIKRLCLTVVLIVLWVVVGNACTLDMNSAGHTPPPADSPYVGAWANFISESQCCVLSNYTFEEYIGLAQYAGQCGGGGASIDFFVTPTDEVRGTITYGAYAPCNKWETGDILGTCPTYSYCSGTITTKVGEAGFTMTR